MLLENQACDAGGDKKQGRHYCSIMEFLLYSPA